MATKTSTAIVYVVSPNDYQYPMFSSLRSLIYSGTSFDKVLIKCIGNKPKSWSFRDERVEVEEVKPAPGTSFFINKINAVKLQFDRVIFLDADTIVANSLDSIYAENNADFIARPVQRHLGSHVFTQAWDQLCCEWSLQKVKCYNSGFFIIQNGCAPAIDLYWADMIKKLENIKFAETHHGRSAVAEQMGLSLAVSAAGLSTKDMSSIDHVYAWHDHKWREKIRECKLLHYSGRPPRITLQAETEVRMGLVFKKHPCNGFRATHARLRSICNTTAGLYSYIRSQCKHGDF